ncbi:tax1-binding protein 1 isoform X2 [Lethenteron reissneri]|uniref:tax1-binding protein 1 isoform X2 n=1 Tax=Lethenteron reissneri TaxID=7753 RepID=UPI002AB64384|nr:tax1-binding protein 1 isoform X2 [Lethenteron reissneri]
MAELVQTPPVGDGNLEPYSFSHVIFHNVAQAYPPDTHLECRYTLTQHIQPHSKDWVGIFKVGWRTPRDYFTFLWAPVPSSTQTSLGSEQHLIFQAYYLPKDDGEFYQLCYVTSNGEIRGASTPFQFRNSSESDELFTLETEGESDILVVTSKAAQLKNSLEEMQRQYKELSQAKSDMEAEVTGMNEKIKQLSEELDGRRKEDCALQSRYTELEQSKQALDSGLVQHKRQLEESAVRVQQLEGDLETLAKKMLDKEMELDGCKDSIKKLTAEKQQLETELKNEREEKNLFMTHIKETDLENKQLNTNLKAAQAEVGEKNNAISELTEEISRLQQSAAHRERSLCGAAGAVSSKPEELGVVRELLRRTEDQLANSEQKLKLLQGELLDATSTRDKMMASLYQERTSSEELRTLVTQMENKNVEGLREDSPGYDELRKENEDLKLRLQMGAEHYKEKFKECMRLQKELTKAKQQWDEQVEAPAVVSMETQKSPPASEMKENLGGELSSRAMEKLAEKTDKCKKYKEMFKKEKENRERLEEELQKLQRSIEEEKRATEVLSDKLAREQANMQDQLSTKALELKDVWSALEKIKKEKEDLLTKFTHEKEDKQLLEEKVMRMETFFNEQQQTKQEISRQQQEKDFAIYELQNTLKELTDEIDAHKMQLHERDGKIDELVATVTDLKLVREEYLKKFAFLEEKCDTGQGGASGGKRKLAAHGCAAIFAKDEHFDIVFSSAPMRLQAESLPLCWLSGVPGTRAVKCYVFSGMLGNCGICNPWLHKPVVSTGPYPHHVVKNQPFRRDYRNEQNVDGNQLQQEPEPLSFETMRKRCPICEINFPPDYNQGDFEEHVQSHWKECPLCKNQYPPDMDQQKFEEHVQSHLDGGRVHPDDTIF